MAFEGDDVTLGELAQVQAPGQPEVSMARCLLIIIVRQQVEYFNVGKTLNRTQVAALVDDIINRFPYMTPTEVATAFSIWRQTAQVYDRLDPNILLQAVREYDWERDALCEAEQYARGESGANAPDTVAGNPGADATGTVAGNTVTGEAAGADVGKPAGETTGTAAGNTAVGEQMGKPAGEATGTVAGVRMTRVEYDAWLDSEAAKGNPEAKRMKEERDRTRQALLDAREKHPSRGGGIWRFMGPLSDSTHGGEGALTGDNV